MSSREIVFPDSYAERKAITMGLMDIAAFTAIAHTLKVELTDFEARRTFFYYVFILIIILSMILQVIYSNFYYI